MGDFFDVHVERCYREDTAPHAQYTKTGKIRKQTALWTMKDGTRIRICNMNDGHLANAITLLERVAKHGRLQSLENLWFMSRFLRGEIALDMVDEALVSFEDTNWIDYVPMIYHSLTLENERRKNMARTFHIAGVQHHQLKHVIADLEAGLTLDLVPEPDNKFDSNAVRIEHNKIMLGYVPKKFSSEISALLELEDLECVIEKLDSKAPPWEQCSVTIDKREE